MDWRIAIEVVTMLGGLAVFLVGGGRFVGRIESAVGRIGGVEEQVKKIPIIETKVDTLAELVRHHVNSDHPRLASDSKEVEHEVVRLRALSEHDVVKGG